MCGYKCTYVSKASAVRDSLIHGVRDLFICEVHDSFIRGVQTTVPRCMDLDVHMSAMQVRFVTPSYMEFVNHLCLRCMTHLYVECRLLYLYVWI